MSASLKGRCLAEQTEWLRQQLETGPMLYTDLCALAGTPNGGLTSASVALGVVRRKVWRDGREQTEWRLPGDTRVTVPDHMPERDLGAELARLIDNLLDQAEQLDRPPMLVVAIPLEGQMVARQNIFDNSCVVRRDSLDWQRFRRSVATGPEWMVVAAMDAVYRTREEHA